MKQTNFHPIYLLPRVWAREMRDRVVMETTNRRGRKLTSSRLIHLHFYPTNKMTTGRNSGHRRNGREIQLRLPIAYTRMFGQHLNHVRYSSLTSTENTENIWNQRKLCEETNATPGNFDSWFWKDWSAKAANKLKREIFLFSAGIWGTCKAWRKSPYKLQCCVYLNIEMNWFVRRMRIYNRGKLLVLSQDTVVTFSSLSRVRWAVNQKINVNRNGKGIMSYQVMLSNVLVWV